MNGMSGNRRRASTRASFESNIDAWYGNKMTKQEKIAVFDKKLLQLDEKIRELKNVKKLIAECKRDVMEGRE